FHAPRGPSLTSAARCLEYRGLHEGEGAANQGTSGDSSVPRTGLREHVATVVCWPHLGCISAKGRLPALRRARTTSSGLAPALPSPRPFRAPLIASPVARATADTPPKPIAPASAPAHGRCCRSSTVAFNRRHF